MFLRSDPADPANVIYTGPTMRDGVRAPDLRGMTPRPGTMAGMRAPASRPASSSSARPISQRSSRPPSSQRSIIYRGGDLAPNSRMSRPGSAQPRRHQASGSKTARAKGTNSGLQLVGSGSSFRSSAAKAKRPLSARSRQTPVTPGAFWDPPPSSR